MKLTSRIVILAMTWVITLPVFAGAPQSAEVSTDAIIYKNAKYGFTFSLPEAWKGYTIVTDQWEASDAQKGVVERGPVVYIRPPDWTKENRRQDIPIMIFTVEQWDSVEHGDFFIGGVAIVPGELGRNRKYAFAVSRRVEDSEAAGAKEVNQILQHHPLRPIWSK